MIAWFRKYFKLINIVLSIYIISFLVSFIFANSLNFVEHVSITNSETFQDGKIWKIFTGITLTNIMGSFLMAFLGIFFGVSSITYLIESGMIFGKYFFNTFENTNLTNTILAYGPHALFEIPALIISMTLGVSLGTIVIKKYNEKYKNNNSMKITKTIILTLAIIAFLLPSQYLGENYRIVKALLLMPLFWLIAKTARETKLFESREWKQTLLDGLNIFIKVVIPLYVIAGIIEIR